MTRDAPSRLAEQHAPDTIVLPLHRAHLLGQRRACRWQHAPYDHVTDFAFGVAADD